MKKVKEIKEVKEVTIKEEYPLHPAVSNENIFKCEKNE